MSDHDSNSPDDPLDIAHALERHRPTLDALELDVLKRRVLRHTRTTITTSTKGTFMRSRTAITTLLASGLLLSGGGTALGVSALQSTSNPAAAQYGTPGVAPGPTLGGTSPAGASTPPTVPGTPPSTPVPAGTGEVAEESASGGSPEEVTPDDGVVAGESASSGDPAAASVQAPRQVGTISGDSLPFTGYASIPVLLLGVGLFAAGLLLRRRSVQI